MKEKAKVLIAESAGEYCAKCASLLKTYGFEAVIVPRDGLAVVQMVGEMRPKVVLMVVFMPRLGRHRRDEICQGNESWI